MLGAAIREVLQGQDRLQLRRVFREAAGRKRGPVGLDDSPFSRLGPARSERFGRLASRGLRWRHPGRRLRR
jgi:hypothetical protein